MTRAISKELALKRIDTILNYIEEQIKDADAEYKKNHFFNPLNGEALLSELCLSLKQTIVDLSVNDSEYRKFTDPIIAPFSSNKMVELIGALKSLRKAYENDFLTNINEMIDAELFTDILEQAEYLLSQNYIRASSVVAGVALESHLRKLAEKNSISISDAGKYKNADSLNGELHRNNIIAKTDSKSVTSWLGLRNDAAHPDSKEMDGENVKLVIKWIKLFIKKYPA